MTEIPPDITTSAAQAGFQAREVAKERDARRAGGVDATQRAAKSIEESDTTVDTEDGDTAIFTSAEGQGGSGRSLDEEAEETPPGDNETPTGDVILDDDGQPHLDVEA